MLVRVQVLIPDVGSLYSRYKGYVRTGSTAGDFPLMSQCKLPWSGSGLCVKSWLSSLHYYEVVVECLRPLGLIKDK